MTEQVLDILKLVLLALLYLFFGRVLWAVWSEVRAPGNVRSAGVGPAPATDPNSPTVPAVRPASRKRREVRPPRGRAGRARFVVLEPKAARGQRTSATARSRSVANQVHDYVPSDSRVEHHARVFEPKAPC